MVEVHVVLVSLLVLFICGAAKNKSALQDRDLEVSHLSGTRTSQSPDTQCRFYTTCCVFGIETNYPDQSARLCSPWVRLKAKRV